MTHTHLTVAAVVERHQRFLFVEEIAGGAEVINQPAGHVEPGESLLDAVIRETLEETAWVFNPTAIIGIYLWQHPTKNERFLRAVFSGEVVRHESGRQLDDGILRAVWLSRDDLVARSEQLRSPMVLQAVDDYQAGTRYPLTMFQQSDIDELTQRAVVV